MKMTMQEARSQGGKVRGKIQREESLKKYYLNPVKCKNCEKIVEIPENKRISEVKKQKFCSQSCSAKYNNSRKIKKVYYCKSCQKETIPNTSKYCKKCLKDILGLSELENKTKGELFKNSKNWQSARSNIRRHAYKTYMRSNLSKKCYICSYDKSFQVCHKKPVSEFSDDTLIKEINNINNLIALCRNCHWEYDVGLLKLIKAE